MLLAVPTSDLRQSNSEPIFSSEASGYDLGIEAVKTDKATLPYYVTSEARITATGISFIGFLGSLLFAIV